MADKKRAKAPHYVTYKNGNVWNSIHVHVFQRKEIVQDLVDRAFFHLNKVSSPGTESSFYPSSIISMLDQANIWKWKVSQGSVEFWETWLNKANDASAL